MRSPGRCTNHETCWLGNGQRTIQIAIADPFCCPICGGGLVPPPLEAIARQSINSAIATSLVLILAAGGSGFGLMEALRLGSMGVSPPAAKARLALIEPAQKRPMPAVPTQKLAAVLIIPVPATVKLTAEIPIQHSQPALAPAQTIPPVPIKTNTPGIVELATRRLSAPLPHILIATNVSQEPVRATAQPISFGHPVPPEEDAPRLTHRWHYRPAIAPVRHTEFLPAPGWSSTGEEATRSGETAPAMVQTISAVVEGGTVADAGMANAVPDAAASPSATSTTIPEIPVTSLPTITASATPLVSPTVPPATWLTTAAPTLPDNQPASRVDPAEAAELDQAPDAPRRLATLPPARPEKLAIPAYPIVEESVERPGRVEVGCIITQHGLPDRCQVQHEVGGEQFSDAVLDWLKSGVVRYRPHVAHGQPVIEARDYRVRFEP